MRTIKGVVTAQKRVNVLLEYLIEIQLICQGKACIDACDDRVRRICDADGMSDVVSIT